MAIGKLNHRLLYSFFLFATLLQQISGSKLPDKFFGKWELGESENYDEYLEAKGYHWMLRLIIKGASCTRTFTKKSDNSFRLQIDTPRSNVDWDNIELGKEFEATYLDESIHKIEFTYVTSPIEKLIEKHTKPDTKNPEVYEYRFGHNGNLFMVMETDGVTAKRFYKRV